jgi:hypothetical protein
MAHAPKRCAAAAVFLITFSACQIDDPTAPGSPGFPGVDSGAGLTIGTPAGQTAPDRTPFQLALMETMARRAVKGLPVPSNVCWGSRAT